MTLNTAIQRRHWSDRLEKLSHPTWLPNDRCGQISKKYKNNNKKIIIKIRKYPLEKQEFGRVTSKLTRCRPITGWRLSLIICSLHSRSVEIPGLQVFLKYINESLIIPPKKRIGKREMPMNLRMDPRARCLHIWLPKREQGISTWYLYFRKQKFKVNEMKWIGL